MMTTYDSIGRGCRATRRPDPRIAAQVRAALTGVGNRARCRGRAGSYEPPPRPVRTAAVAEALPLRDQSVDAALAVLTVRHWTDPATGRAELRRSPRSGHLIPRP